MNKWPYLIGVDVETTGLNHYKESIIELGAVIMDYSGNYISEFSSFCNPGRPIPAESTKIHNITNDMVKGYPTPEKVVENFFKWVKENSEDKVFFFFHNAPFDAKFVVNTAIKGNISYTNFRTVDTLKWTRSIPHYKGCANYKLESLTKFIGYTPSDNHRAKEDAKSALELTKNNIRILKNNGVDKLYKMYDLFEKIGMPLSYYSEPKNKSKPKTIYKKPRK